MKRKEVRFVFIFLLISILFISLVSAGIFSDLAGKITGKPVVTPQYKLGCSSMKEAYVIGYRCDKVTQTVGDTWCEHYNGAGYKYTGTCKYTYPGSNIECKKLINTSCSVSPVCPAGYGEVSKTACCIDSDGGKNYYIFGEASNMDRPYSFGGKDVCLKDNQRAINDVQERTLFEAVCLEDGVGTLISYTCPDKCEEGVCVDEEESIPCSETDDGINYYEKGKACLGETCKEDFCTGNQLTEYYIEDEGIMGGGFCEPLTDIFSKIVDCPIGYTCGQGACIKNDPQQTCNEIGGIICPSNKECFGELVIITEEGDCCPPGGKCVYENVLIEEDIGSGAEFSTYQGKDVVSDCELMELELGGYSSKDCETHMGYYQEASSNPAVSIGSINAIVEVRGGDNYNQYVETWNKHETVDKLANFYVQNEEGFELESTSEEGYVLQRQVDEYVSDWVVIWASGNELIVLIFEDWDTFDTGYDGVIEEFYDSYQNKYEPDFWDDNYLVCEDTDGGREYYEFGIVFGNYGSENPDFCEDAEVLRENWCMNNEHVYDQYNCPNGCYDGECIAGNCQNLIEFVSDPEDFEYGSIEFANRWNYSEYGNTMWVDGEPEEYDFYVASWSTYYDDSWQDIHYQLSVFDDEDVDLSGWLEERTSYEMCELTTIWGNDNKENRIYVCNWQASEMPRVDLDAYQGDHRTIYWVSDNVIVELNTYVGQRLSEEEIILLAERATIEFLNSLMNNQPNYFGRGEDFSINYPISGLIEVALTGCYSDIDLGTCNPCWSCRTEPTICPPHGYQTKTCVDNCCGGERETQQMCSPGICSGCYVPRWYGYELGESKCIPYGFRVQHQIGTSEELKDYVESDRLYQESSDDYSLVIASEDLAYFNLSNGNELLSYELIPGDEIKIIIPGEEDVIYYFTTDDIYYSESDPLSSYVDYTIKYSAVGRVPETMNAYCDIDGQLKRQKVRQANGDWATCQNNYECESNVCSSGECIELQSLLDQAGAFKRLGVRIICRILNPLSTQEFNDCIVDFLGNVEGQLETAGAFAE